MGDCLQALKDWKNPNPTADIDLTCRESLVSVDSELSSSLNEKMNVKTGASTSSSRKPSVGAIDLNRLPNSNSQNRMSQVRGLQCIVNIDYCR